jgi:hypothetical protein
MKLAIVGGRDFNDKELFNKTMIEFIDKVSVVISGAAKGADTFGENWAKENKIDTIIHLPNWEKHGKAAGYVRNKLIIEDCDMCIAFWDGKSKGTESSIKLCKQSNKPIKIVKYETIYRGNTVQ